MNYGAHVKFVTKWLERLEAEAKQGSAPSSAEPGLVTEPALATEPDPETEPPIAGTAQAFRVHADRGPESPDVPVGDENADRQKLLKVAQGVEA
jgi:thioredoxin-dependent peroxiredoxin